MNYYQPLEMADAEGKPAGKWHYTCTNDGILNGRSFPVGYCGAGRLPGDTAEKCPGHDTPEGAAEHYRQWLLDHKLRLDGARPNGHYGCAVCGVLTDQVAKVDHRSFHLCDDHRNREHVEALFEAPTGLIMSSW